MAKEDDNGVGMVVEVTRELSHYSDEIESDAKLYGYKAANLIR